jgi:hypothetical protein
MTAKQSTQDSVTLERVVSTLASLLARKCQTADEALRVVQALGAGAIEPLIQIAIGDFVDAPGMDRWLIQFFAIELIGVLLPPAAIRPLYAGIVHRERDNERYNDEELELDERLVAALRRFGRAALEPGLEALATTPDQWTRVCVTEVLATLGLRDERVRAVLLRGLEIEPEWIANHVADYGDASLLGDVIARLDAYEVKGRPDQDDVDAVRGCAEAIVKLGGKITPAQRRKLAAVDPNAAERAGLTLFMRRQGRGGWSDPGGSGELN